MNLIPLPYRILVLVLMIFAVIGTAYKAGVSRESDRRDALALKQTNAAIATADKESTRREAVGAQREVAREQIHIEYRTIKEKADESIKTNPAGYDCVMDSDGLRLWNAANAGTAAPLSGEPDHRLLDAAIGEIGTSGRAVAEPHRGDGAVHAVPGSAEEAGGVRESSVNGERAIDETTSHSTSPSKNDRQVAGYHESPLQKTGVGAIHELPALNQ